VIVIYFSLQFILILKIRKYLLNHINLKAQKPPSPSPSPLWVEGNKRKKVLLPSGEKIDAGIGCFSLYRNGKTEK